MKETNGQSLDYIVPVGAAETTFVKNYDAVLSGTETLHVHLHPSDLITKLVLLVEQTVFLSFE